MKLDALFAYMDLQELQRKERARIWELLPDGTTVRVSGNTVETSIGTWEWSTVDSCYRPV